MWPSCESGLDLLSAGKVDKFYLAIISLACFQTHSPHPSKSFNSNTYRMNTKYKVKQLAKIGQWSPFYLSRSR